MKPKFKIGDKVWIIACVEETRRQCPYCDGFGHIDAKTKEGWSFETRCPICDGSGLIKTNVWDLTYSEPKEIVGYSYEKISGVVSIRYKIDDSWRGFEFQENYMFKTKIAADYAVKKMNEVSIQRRIAEIKSIKNKD